MSTNNQGDKSFRALRGAITVEANEADAIVTGTSTLLRAILDRNGVELDDLVSLIFTTTADLDAEFPAAGARAIGIAHVPLLCAQEIQVPGDVERCIRVLVHLYTDRDQSSLRHVYMGRAKHLRNDLPG